MPWRLAAECQAGRIPPALAQIEPLVAIAYEAFNAICVVEAMDGDAIVLRIRHLGGTKLQMTLVACLQRQLDMALPGHYEARLLDPGGPFARLLVSVNGAH